MADEALETSAIEGLQGTELMGRPLRINKAEPRGGGGGPRRGGGGSNYSEPASSYVNKSSGAEGWEDRSYGNSSENSDFENGRSRRKRSVASNSEISQEGN